MAVETADVDGGEVTFVGGKAVEQTTEGETPSGDHGDELAAAKAAVKKAMEADLKEEGKRAAKEAKDHLEKDPGYTASRDADGKFAKTPEGLHEAEKAKAVKALEKTPGTGVEKSEAEKEDADASALKKALSDRKEAAKYKAEQNAELERGRAEVRAIWQQVQQEKAEIAKEKERYARLRSSPVEALREAGYGDPTEFIMDVAQDGTPEGQARRANRELLERLDRAEAWQKQELQRREEHARAQEAEQGKQFRANVERHMLTTAFAKTTEGKEAHPHIAAFYKDDHVALLVACDAVAEQYREVTTIRDPRTGRVLQAGKEASFAELAEYLEEKATKWYKSMSGAQAAPPILQGSPTQGSATGPARSGKTLSSGGTGERRTLGTGLADLEGEERREAAMVAVRAALHHSGER